jgi:predicted SnoaL-like aldol condensation-catalyzing enzyme
MSSLEKNKAATKTALEILFNSSIPLADKRRDIVAYISPEKYIQHSPGLANGLDDLLDLVEEFDKSHPGYSVAVNRVMAEGDMTVAHCHYKFGDDDPHGKAIVEIFRFEDGLMVEHWDVIQDVPVTDKNGNGMF